jgi:hypothetical protein
MRITFYLIFCRKSEWRKLMEGYPAGEKWVKDVRLKMNPMKKELFYAGVYLFNSLSS